MARGMSTEKSVGAVWVKTTPTADGSAYVVTLEANQDHARILTPADALTYAGGVLDAAARAEYDAAVLAQLTRKLSVPLEDAVQMVTDLRADRPPLDRTATAPLVLEPGVNHHLKPFISITVAGQPPGQWDMADARQHALQVLEAVTAADLDAAYFRTLIGVIGIEEARARNVIADLGNYRETAP